VAADTTAINSSKGEITAGQGEWFEVEEGEIEVGCQGEVLYRGSGEMYGSVQDQVGWGARQPGLGAGLEVGGPAQSRGVGT